LILGYSGIDCMSDSSESKNYSPALLGLIITLFIIICVLVASVVLMIRQVSAYRDDMTNYQVIIIKIYTLLLLFFIIFYFIFFNCFILFIYNL
jgi:hypothetical protein